ncbi:MAG: choice-of-anchor B family protein [Planctomycetes bacterium]|nr:choice-of-anchor B family protein [Planctomycetota bacterium]
MKRPLHALCLLLLAAASAVAHEDDPKLLDRVPPYVGPGYAPGAGLPRPGRPARLAPAPPGGSTALVSGVGGGDVSFPAQGVTLVSWLPLGQLDPGSTSGNDCWGYVSGSGREYALIGLSDGTAFVDLADPSDPQVVSFQPGPPSLWRDVKTYQHYAYAVSEGGSGIQVFDLAAIDAGTVSLVNTITTGGVTSSHNVAIDTQSGYLYRCGGASDTGLRMYSLANPAAPQYVGAWHGRYVHDAQIVTYTSGPYAGKQVAFACGGFGNGSVGTGLTILDVTNKNAPVVLAQYSYPGGRYSHQAWLSADRQLLYLDDELDENGTLPTTTHVIDVSNLSAPVRVSTFTNGNGAIGHNLYVLGDRVYEANYRSGLRVFDLTDPLHGVEVAAFDTWPSDDHDAFNGLWSCYPYLPSGLVLGSDLEKGLFVWHVGTPPLAFDVPGGAPTRFDAAGDAFTVTLHEAAPGDLLAGSASLWLDAGAGLVQLPLVPLGGDAWRADVPATPCGAEVRWFLGARDAGGVLWTYPPEAPFTSLRSLASDAEGVYFADDCESGTAGWTVGAPGDDATAGTWELGDPQGGLASPEDDHTPGGTLCWTTGLAAGVDVDGGSTSLVGPAVDLSTASDPLLEFWYFFDKKQVNPQTIDRLRVEVSVDDGASWTLLESIQTTSHASEATWRFASYRLAAFVTPSATTRVRFVAADLNVNSEVEAAVDDVRVVEALCGCGVAPGCAAAPNSSGSGCVLSASGAPALGLNDLVLEASGGVPGQFGVYFYGAAPAAAPFGDGTLCVGGATYRLQPPVAFDAAGHGSRALDLTAAPAAAGPGAITAGSTHVFQLWYRDPQGPGGSGFNLSSSLVVDFCP